MACPTCDATLEYIGITGNGGRVFHCPRCGTAVQYFGEGPQAHAYVPKLVERCREFETDPLLPLLLLGGEVFQVWRRLGIAESIHVPADRGPK